MKFNLEGLSLEQMMQLRMVLNAQISAIEEAAFKDLSEGKPVEGFTLAKGKKSRYIKDDKAYRNVLKRAFGDAYRDLCVTESVLPLTKAEALIKSQFDDEDKKEILTELAETLDTKRSASKLVYVGVTNGEQ